MLVDEHQTVVHTMQRVKGSALHGCLPAGYPERNPDTRDYYARPVGTERIDMDCGIPVGMLSQYYDNVYWNRGNNVLRTSDDDPRVKVQSENVSLIIMDSCLAYGETYICYVEVDNNWAEQMITLLSYSEYLVTHTHVHTRTYTHTHTHVPCTVSLLLLLYPLNTATPRIGPTENVTVAVPNEGKENITFTCSMEAQTGSDTLQSVAVSWTHNREPTASARHTVHTNTVLNRTEGYLLVVSFLTISDLELADSAPVSCHVSITSITAQDRKLKTLHLSTAALLFVISESNTHTLH